MSDLVLTQGYYSTDFMGDMAFVSQCPLRWLDAYLTCLSFGGGFEMMKDGRDIDGIWTLLESGIWYVPRESSLSVT
jgi:hypothetical protein